MIVSDLHGDGDAFDRCLEHFQHHHASGEADRLVVLGDLIHGYGSPEDDASLRMVLDVIALQAELGADRVLMLLGNHEMPHIYSVTLAKGDTEFTPRFEHALGEHRAAVLDFFKRLPLYARMESGVLLSHAGPAPDALPHLDALRQLDHDAVLADADNVLSQAEDIDSIFQQYEQLYGVPYDTLAEHYLAVQGPDDPRYSHLLRGFMISHQNAPFVQLWDVLFTQNDVGKTIAAYEHECRQFLAALSVDAPAEQQIAVSGHIPTRGGHAVVNPHHLRLASAAHATPREDGEYLLLDCDRAVRNVHELLDGLRPVF